MNLEKNLKYISANWNSYREHCISTNKFGNQVLVEKLDHNINKTIKDNLPELLRLTIKDSSRYLIKGSVAQGNLSVAPWVCVMDKNITSDTKEGWYVVYLISRNAKYIYLSLMLATHQFADNLDNEKSIKHSKKSLKKISNSSEKLKNLFKIHNPFPGNDQIDLLENSYDEDYLRPVTGTSKYLAESYEKGTIFFKRYDFSSSDAMDKITNDILENDLNIMLDCYRNIAADPQSKNIEFLSESYLEIKDDLDFDYELKELELNKIPHNDPKNDNIGKKSTKRSKSRRSKNSHRTGVLGENHVQEYEYKKLCKLNRKDLAKKIEMHCHKKEYPGYDITSYDSEGNKIFIEVKSTLGTKIDSFIMTSNEWKGAEREKQKYFIYLVNNIRQGRPKIFGIINNPYAQWNDKYLSKKIASYEISLYMEN